MQWSDQFDRRKFSRHEPDPEDRGPEAIWNALVLFGLCAVFASLAPRELFAASLSSLLVFAVVSCAFSALMRGESVTDGRPTHWDAAALFMLLSIVLSWAVDPESLRAYLEAQGQQAAAGTR